MIHASQHMRRDCGSSTAALWVTRRGRIGALRRNSAQPSRSSSTAHRRGGMGQPRKPDPSTCQWRVASGRWAIEALPTTPSGAVEAISRPARNRSEGYRAGRT